MFLSSTEPVCQEVPTILYTVPLYGIDDTGVFFFPTTHSAKFCLDTYSAYVLKMNKLSACKHFKHAVTLYKTQHITHTITVRVRT
jgi:hypothetical protein